MTAHGCLLQFVQHSITNKSLDATGVCQYMRCGGANEVQQVKKNIEIQGDKNGVKLF
jgi:hypothetical protein